jgi:hypothetical protein
MKNRFKFLGIIAVVIIGISVTGCMTTSIVMYAASPSTDFTILGEVTHTATSGFFFAGAGGRQQGMTDFLAAARRQFPETDFVVDIMVDRQTTRFLFWRSHGYIFRGTAIRYN